MNSTQQSTQRFLPIGIGDFGTMISNNYIYVDKTELIYNLFSTGGRYYFLSRPRRFGKSLLLSTLKELFAGNRALFRGLWIDSSDYQWQEHPIIHIDFGALTKTTPESLEAGLIWELKKVAKKYNIDISEAPNLNEKFTYLMEELGKINKVVILIDEYDKPILDAIESIDKAILMRNALKNFYDTFKSVEAHVRAIFITGVTKFARTSIFSGLNNLEELTISSEFNAIIGYTAQELSTYFAPQLNDLAQKENCSVEQILEKIALWYDGYKFSQEVDAIKVYNPYSTLLYLKHGKFDTYWFKTGTPTFLMKLIKHHDLSLININSIVALEEELEAFDITAINIKTLLFQTGYLTIDYYDAAAKSYRLKLPNVEVKEAFLSQLFNSFTGVADKTIMDRSVANIVLALRRNDVDTFCHILQTLFAHIPYDMHISLERYYQSIVFVMVLILGLQVSVEMHTNVGRIDMVIEIDNYVYVIEFKIRGTTQEALDQIETKQYYQKYLMSDKRIFLVGILFDVEKRNVDSWTVKEVDVVLEKNNF